MYSNKFEDEADWRLFKKKIAEWVERYFQKRNEAYIRLLQGEGTAKDKWWKLHDQMKEDIDQFLPGTRMKRSLLRYDLSVMVRMGIINLEELELFDPELQEKVIDEVVSWTEGDYAGKQLVAEWEKKHSGK